MRLPINRAMHARCSHYNNSFRAPLLIEILDVGTVGPLLKPLHVRNL